MNLFMTDRKCITALIFSLLLSGCGGSGSNNNTNGTEENANPNVSENIDQEAPSPDVTQMIGAAGGQITSLDGSLILDIPAGALLSSTEIGIRKIESSELDAEFQSLSLGQSYDLTPDGLQFETPITITITEDTRLPSSTEENSENDSVSVSFGHAELFSISGGIPEYLSNTSATLVANGVQLTGELAHFSSLVVFTSEDMVIEKPTPAIGYVGGDRFTTQIRARRVQELAEFGKFQGIVASFDAIKDPGTGAPPLENEGFKPPAPSPGSDSIISDIKEDQFLFFASDGALIDVDLAEDNALDNVQDIGTISGICTAVGNAKITVPIAVADFGLTQAFLKFTGGIRSKPVVIKVQPEVSCLEEGDVGPQLPDAKFINVHGAESATVLGKPPYRNFPNVNERLFGVTGAQTKLVTQDGGEVDALEAFGLGNIGVLYLQPPTGETDFLFEFGIAGTILTPLDGGISTAGNGNTPDASHPLMASGEADFSKVLAVNFADNVIKRFEFNAELGGFSSNEVIDGQGDDVVNGRLISIAPISENVILAVTVGLTSQLLGIDINTGTATELATIASEPRRIRCNSQHCAISHADDNSGMSTLTTFALGSNNIASLVGLSTHEHSVDQSPISIDLKTTPTQKTIIIATAFTDQTATALVLNDDGTLLESANINLGDLGVSGSGHALFLSTAEQVNRLSTAVFTGFDSNNAVLLPLGVFSFTNEASGLTE